LYKADLIQNEKQQSIAFDDCKLLKWRKPRNVEMKDAISLQNAEALKSTLGGVELQLNDDDTKEAH
jgi:4-hydroxyphenylpyruvate dioxygenase-like putative hemolysin